MKTFYDFETARQEAELVVKCNPGMIVFIMSKDLKFSVVVGWDRRDKAIKNGWHF